MGGATDLRCRFGVEGKELIKGRGRWDSDIVGIYMYQRTLVSDTRSAARHNPSPPPSHAPNRCNRNSLRCEIAPVAFSSLARAAGARRKF